MAGPNERYLARGERDDSLNPFDEKAADMANLMSMEIKKYYPEGHVLKSLKVDACRSERTYGTLLRGLSIDADGENGLYCSTLVDDDLFLKDLTWAGKINEFLYYYRRRFYGSIG